MATMTSEQIEQKKQLLAEKIKEMKAIYDEIVEAGEIELTEEELDTIAGGGTDPNWFISIFKKWGQDIVDFFTGR